jgi:hypothetical protein
MTDKTKIEIELPPDELEYLDYVCNAKDMTRSAQLRQMIRIYQQWEAAGNPELIKSEVIGCPGFDDETELDQKSRNAWVQEWYFGKVIDRDKL